MLILKLGGAAITDKATPNTARLGVLRRVAAVLAHYPQPLILIHGAGSFGHILAKEYSLHLGYQYHEQKMALVRLQQQLHELNRLVVQVLVEAGLAAFPVHPVSMCIMEQNRLSEFFLEAVERTLGMGLLPVLYGDCVWDRAQGFGILSGDQLAVYLANALKAVRVAFGTDVDGVLNAAGEVIPRFDLHALTQVGGAATTDVTGGMLGKLKEIAGIRADVQTWIFNLQNDDHLERILSGEGGVGTLLVSSQG